MRMQLSEPLEPSTTHIPQDTSSAIKSTVQRHLGCQVLALCKNERAREQATSISLHGWRKLTQSPHVQSASCCVQRCGKVDPETCLNAGELTYLGVMASEACQNLLCKLYHSAAWIGCPTWICCVLLYAGTHLAHPPHRSAACSMHAMKISLVTQSLCPGRSRGAKGHADLATCPEE